MNAVRGAGFRLGISLAGFLAFPPVANAMESTLLRHALLQVPLLAVAGSLLAADLTGKQINELRRYDGHGAAGMILTVAIALFWMLPRSLDAAVIRGEIEAAKFLTVPCAGFLLKLSWPRLGFVGKSFLLLNAISMLVAVGWLYRVAPVRLCNAYLINDQAVLGTAYFVLSGVILGWVLWRGCGGCRRSDGAMGQPTSSQPAVDESERVRMEAP